MTTRVDVRVARVYDEPASQDGYRTASKDIDISHAHVLAAAVTPAALARRR